MTTPNEELIRRSEALRIQSSATTSPNGKERLLSADLNRQPDSGSLVPFNGVLINRLLTHLEGEDFTRLLPHMEYVALAAGEDVQVYGEELEYAFFPETAVLSHVFFLEDGSTTGAALVGNDGVVGLSMILSENQSKLWVQVIIGGGAVRIRLPFIKQEFARGGGLQKAIFSYTNSRLGQLSQRAVCNGRHTLRQRLCTWLLMVRDLTTEEQLPLTHEQIAVQLGARRAGVTNGCNMLKDCGILGYRRGSIRILDRGRLEAAACECYRVLRLDSDWSVQPN